METSKTEMDLVMRLFNRFYAEARKNLKVEVGGMQLDIPNEAPDEAERTTPYIAEKLFFELPRSPDTNNEQAERTTPYVAEKLLPEPPQRATNNCIDEISECAIQEYLQEGPLPSLLEQKLDECRRTVDLLRRIDFLLHRWTVINQTRKVFSEFFTEEDIDSNRSEAWNDLPRKPKTESPKGRKRRACRDKTRRK
ncbi:hypothetical protein QR680_018842 [Steinernema hermaphroditum]|uniref:Uncharacterized protein n=1 Tax=Steinernema hermaphroditum TaxID=289476 RepID=A0AA39LRD0_9BILA|nr:hypothetical protein QR680_018842 [Steinernema hermaphroditum]